LHKVANRQTVRQTDKQTTTVTYPLTKTDLNSLDFVINRFFMKLFRTSNIDTVKTYQLQFSFELPSVIIEKRAKNLKIVLLKLTIHTLTTFEVSGVAGIELLTLLFTFMV